MLCLSTTTNQWWGGTFSTCQQRSAHEPTSPTPCSTTPSSQVQMKLQFQLCSPKNIEYIYTWVPTAVSQQTAWWWPHSTQRPAAWWPVKSPRKWFRGASREEPRSQRRCFMNLKVLFKCTQIDSQRSNMMRNPKQWASECSERSVCFCVCACNILRPKKVSCK